MPIRIYALAKEIKVDSKELVERCAQLGLQGKGSALASLDDDEADKVRDSYKQKAAPAPTAEKPAVKDDAPIKREDYVPQAGAFDKPVPSLRRSRPKQPTPPPKEEPTTPEEPPSPTPPAGPVAEPEEVAASTSQTEPVADAKPERPKFSNEGPLRSIMSQSSVPPLGSRIAAAKGQSDKGDNGPPDAGAKKREKPAPGAQIRLAAMPVAPNAPATNKSNEPAPQRPDLKLPADAIKASKMGAKPLAEHLKKHEEKRRAETEGPKVGAGSGSKGPLGRRGGKDGDGDGKLGGREMRQLNRKRAARRRRGDDDDGGSSTSRTLRRQRRGASASTAAPRKGKVAVELPCTVRAFSEAAGVPANRILGMLLKMGSMGNINSVLDEENAEILAMELGLEIELKSAETLEDSLITSLEEREDDDDSLQARPPVITFLGHVDHGKTSLLDYLIGSNVVSGESGGITQHIRAYQIDKDGKRISFVDTPGHEAFTEMRARGANVTDVAVLVVAADDGVMPQTEEAISHARAAEVPIVVALNKIDLPGVDANKALQDLAANELLPSEWGGETEVVKTSAITGEGMDDLLETLLTIAELHEFSANPDRPAIGTCLEAQLHEGRGVVCKFIVQKGTLRVGDVVVCGAGYGRVKAMYDTLNPSVTYEAAAPSMPVDVIGLNVAPDAGEHFYVLDDVADAREIAESREEASRAAGLAGAPIKHVTLENLFDRLAGSEDVETLNIIIRADVRGSLEAIAKELEKLEHPEVAVKVLQKSVGGVTEADVMLAHASDAVILAFNVVPDEGARILADAHGVQIRRYEVIYKLTEDLKASLSGMLKPEEREVELGRALVQKVYVISRVGAIAGCRVLSGKIERGARCRIIRDSRIIGDYPIDSLKREKDDAKEVREGYECGIKLAGFNDVKEADILECYRVEEIAREL